MSIYNLTQGGDEITFDSTLELPRGFNLSTTDPEGLTAPNVTVCQTYSTDEVNLVDNEGNSAGTIAMNLTRFHNMVFVSLSEFNISIDFNSQNPDTIVTSDNALPDGFTVDDSVQCGLMQWSTNGGGYYTSTVEILDSGEISFEFTNDEILTPEDELFPYNYLPVMQFNYTIL